MQTVQRGMSFSPLILFRSSTLLKITNRFLADRTLEPKIVLEPKDPITAVGINRT